MAKTTTDLATEVLRELRVIRRFGQVPAAADMDFVKQRYLGIFEELEDRGKTFWEAESIPDRAFPALTRVIAAECADAFGKEYSAGNAFRRLTALASTEGAGQPTKAQYF